MNTNPVEVLKQAFMKNVRENITRIKENYIDTGDYVTLYHGTCSVYLNDILQIGILPRNETGNDNFKHAQSNEGVVYLTNKWHYGYAFNSVERLLVEKYGEDWVEVEEAQWYNRFNPLPIYVECRVPKALLVPDEDIFYSDFMRKKLEKAVKDGKETIALNWLDCLSQYGTVGVVGGVKKEWITNVTVLGSGHFYLDLMDENSRYRKEMDKWFKGKGKGSLKKDDLKKMEEKYREKGTIGTFRPSMIPAGYMISQFYVRDNDLAFVVNKPEELPTLPVNLERY